MGRKGNIFMGIIVVYIIFIMGYSVATYAMITSLNPSVADMSNTIVINNNKTTVGNITITQQYNELEDVAYGCDSGDTFQCAYSIVGLMFSLQPSETPFAILNYFTVIFSVIFMIAVLSVIGIPLIEAVIPL